MTYQTQQAGAGGIDWTTLISSSIDQIPTWIALARHEPIPVAGGQGGSFVVSPNGVSGTVSPAILILGAGVLVVVILMLRK